MTYAVTNTDTTMRARLSKMEIASPSYLPILSFFLFTRVPEGCQNSIGQLLLLLLLILLLRAITGSELFPYLTCLHTTTFVLLITRRAKLLNTDWSMKRVFLFFIFLCEEGKITRSRLVLRLPSNSLFNREIVTREVVSSRLRPDQHSRSLNN